MYMYIVFVTHYMSHVRKNECAYVARGPYTVDYLHRTAPPFIEPVWKSRRCRRIPISNLAFIPKRSCAPIYLKENSKYDDKLAKGKNYKPAHESNWTYSWHAPNPLISFLFFQIKICTQLGPSCPLCLRLGQQTVPFEEISVAAVTWLLDPDYRNKKTSSLLVICQPSFRSTCTEHVMVACRMLESWYPNTVFHDGNVFSALFNSFSLCRL